MKTIQIVYTCDYCKRPIDQLSEDVKAIIPGRIGYGDKFMADKGGDDIRHYHDYCLENLLDMEYIEETEKAPEPKKEDEADPEAHIQQINHSTSAEETQDEKAPEKVSDKAVDIGRIYALRDAGWTIAKIADDIGCAPSSVHYYLKKREGGQ